MIFMNQEHESYSFYQVLPIEDLPNGERIFIELDGEPIVILILPATSTLLETIVLMMMAHWGMEN